MGWQNGKKENAMSKPIALLLEVNVRRVQDKREQRQLGTATNRYNDNSLYYLYYSNTLPNQIPETNPYANRSTEDLNQSISLKLTRRTHKSLYPTFAIPV